MSSNPKGYLFSSLESCCKQHFSWAYEECIGSNSQSATSGLWYAGWEGGADGCLDDGNAPAYMTGKSFTLCPSLFL